MSWYSCPNKPRCPHGGALHDVYDLEDASPRCCVDGCECGHALRTPSAEYRAARQQLKTGTEGDT